MNSNILGHWGFLFVLFSDNEGNSLNATKITEHNSHHLKETSFNNSVLLFSFN